MKRFNSLVASFVLTLILSAAAFGGDMPGPGSSEKPKGPPEGALVACEPLGSRGEIAEGITCEEATTDITTDAIFFAIQLALSVY
jgi:hypothetical protein